MWQIAARQIVAVISDNYCSCLGHELQYKLLAI